MILMHDYATLLHDMQIPVYPGSVRLLGGLGIQMSIQESKEAHVF